MKLDDKITISDILALITIISTFLYIGGITFLPNKSDTGTVALVLSMAMVVLSFHFGSSSGSKTKNDIIRKMQDGENKVD
jgi:hypothetical protein